MAYKQSPFPMVKGTKVHSSALKQVEKHGRWLLDTSTKEGKAISKQIKGIKTVSSNVSKSIGTKGFSKAKLADAKKFLQSRVVKPKPHVPLKPAFGLSGDIRPFAPEVTKAFKPISKVISKVSKVLPALGLAATLYDFYKSGQKHSGGKAVKGQKPFMKEAKKKTKSIWDKEKSPVKQKTHPKHPVTPPSKKETTKSKGTVKGVTGFEQDIVNPVKDFLLTQAKKHKEVFVDRPTRLVKKKIEIDRKIIKKVKDYFTKK